MGDVSTFSHAYNLFTDSYSSHIEGHSTVFGTGLNYTALRILGVPAEHPIMVKARGTLHKLGMYLSLFISWPKFRSRRSCG